MAKRIKIMIAEFLDRNPQYCWSRLVDWQVFHRWYSLILDNSYIQGLWITELVLFFTPWDRIDMMLMGEGGYRFKNIGCDYCGKCVMRKQRMDGYEQSVALRERRRDRYVERVVALAEG